MNVSIRPLFCPETTRPCEAASCSLPLARRGGTGLQGGPALHRQGGAGGQEGQPFRLPAQVHGGQDLGELHRCRHSGSVRLPGKGGFF